MGAKLCFFLMFLIVGLILCQLGLHCFALSYLTFGKIVLFVLLAVSITEEDYICKMTPKYVKGLKVA